MIFGGIIGAGLSTILFPEKMAVGADIGMCVGIFLAAMTLILTKKKQEPNISNESQTINDHSDIQVVV